MRITKATATNFKGFTNFSQQFGDVNIFAGRNAEGKSSALDILCAAFVTDGDRDLLHVGATEGEILVVLEDGGETIEVRRTIKPGGMSPARVRTKSGGAMSASANFLKSIVDAVTLDPIRQVMTAPAKEQMRILLETLPLEMDAAPVLAAVDGLLPSLKLVDGKANLDTIRGAYDALYKERTDVNRDVKQRGAAAAQFRSTIEGWTAPEGRTWTQEFNRLDQELQDLIAADAEKRHKAETAHATAVQERKNHAVAVFGRIDAEIDAEIAALNQRRQDRKQAEADNCNADTERLTNDHRDLIDGILGGSQEERTRLTGEKARAQQLAEKETQVAQTAKIAEQTEAEAEALREKSDRLTKAIEGLRDCQRKLLEELPIKGLDVSNGTASYNGVPLGELNTAEKAKFWIRVAVLRAQGKRLQVVVIDSCEAFDDQNWPLLLEACKNSGLQFFLARVEPHDFTIQVL